MCVYWIRSGGDPTPESDMTLFQSVKQIKLEDGSDFNLPIGPAFWLKEAAEQWLEVSGLSSEGYQVKNVAPMNMV